MTWRRRATVALLTPGGRSTVRLVSLDRVPVTDVITNASEVHNEDLEDRRFR